MQQIKLTFGEKIIFIMKMVIGTAVSWELAKLIGSKYPFLAPISVFFCLQATIEKSCQFAIARIIGTIIGVILIETIAQPLHPNGWTISLLLLISLIFPFLFRANEIILHQIAFSVLLDFVFEHKLHGYGMDRVRDTLIGVAVALLLNIFLFPPNFTKKAIKEVEDLPNVLVGKLEMLAGWIRAEAAGQNFYEQDMKLIRKRMNKAEQKIKLAESSLSFNPLSSKSKIPLNKIESKLETMVKVLMNIDAMYKSLSECRKAGTLLKEDTESFAEVFTSLAVAVRNWHEGKSINEVQVSPTLHEEGFLTLALWHANQVILELKSA